VTGPATAGGGWGGSARDAAAAAPGVSATAPLSTGRCGAGMGRHSACHRQPVATSVAASGGPGGRREGGRLVPPSPATRPRRHARWPRRGRGGCWRSHHRRQRHRRCPLPGRLPSLAQKLAGTRAGSNVPARAAPERAPPRQSSRVTGRWCHGAAAGGGGVGVAASPRGGRGDGDRGRGAHPDGDLHAGTGGQKGRGAGRGTGPRGAERRGGTPLR